MTCFADNQGVERLLTDILMEVRKISREPSPPAPLPLPPPATKDFVAGMPEKFLALREWGVYKQYIKAGDDNWIVSVVDKHNRHIVEDHIGDQSAREEFNSAREVWVMCPK